MKYIVTFEIPDEEAEDIEVSTLNQAITTGFDEYAIPAHILAVSIEEE